MRLLLVVAALALLPSCSSAWAGETFIGQIYVWDGGSANNAITGYGAAGCTRQTDPEGAGSCDQAFAIGQANKITVQAVGACCVSVNRATTDAGLCLLLADGEKFPSSTAAKPIPASLPDAGSYLGALVTITPPAGAGACRLKVFTRAGTE